MSATSSPPSLTAARQTWQRLAVRERRLVTLAAITVALALLWWLTLAPAFKVWQQSSARQQALDSQWQQLLTLQQQAQALQARPPISRDEAVRALEAAMPTLGSGATLSVGGERATVTLRNVPASALGPWLAQVRSNARTLPAEAHLRRSATSSALSASSGGSPTPSTPPRQPAGAAPAAATSAAPAWDGTLVLVLPTR